MNSIKTENLSVFYADEAGTVEHVLEYAEDLVKGYMRRELFQRVVALYGKRTRMQDTIVVMAHGKSLNGKYCYKDDGEALFNVQRLIDRLDGMAVLIILNICNVDNLPISSGKSIVIHPSSTISLHQLQQGHGHPRIYIPKFGYCEENGCLHRVIESLNRPSSK